MEEIEKAAMALLAELVPASPTPAAGQNMLPPDTRCDVDGTPLWRAHHGPATLFVHGWNDTHRVWRHFALDFIANSRPALLMDLPAHGASRSSEYGGENSGKAVYDVCEAHAPIDAIIAHSFGCVATANALKRGAKADYVVLIAPPVLGWTESLRRRGVDSAVLDRVLEVARSMGNNELGPFDFERALADYQGKLLLIGSDADIGCPIDSISLTGAKIPGAEIHAVSGLGHRELCLDPGVLSKILEFLGYA